MTGNPAQRTLLLLLLALAVLGALGAWLWRGTNEPVLAPGEASPEQAVAQDADFARGDGPGEAASAAPQDAAATGEHRTATAGDGAPARPFPSDAQWLEITVVDATDRTPVAAAEVWWYGAESFAELNEAEGGWSAEAMLLGQDPQAAARRFGWSSRSDAAGKVRVTLRTATVVLAEHDGRYGELQLRENTLPPSNGWQLLLEPDQHLTVRVVDERDQPCAEVPVTLVGIDRDGDVWGGLGWMPLATSTAPDGLATIPHLRHLLRRLQDGRGDLPDGLQVRPSLYLPGALLDHPPIDSANPPREPIVLRLPACGAVAVRAAVLGRPMAEFRNAWLTHQPPDDGGEGTAGGVARHHVSVWQKADAQGVVRFQRVLLGQQYTVYTEAGGGLMQQFAGPVRAGQEVEVVLTVAPNVALLRGRLVEPDGTPAREVAFEFLARGEDLWQHQAGKTDRDGRFTVAAGQLDEPTQADWLWFDVGGSRGSNAGSSAPRRRATAPPRMLRAGSDELGDLVLAEAPLLVAGRIEREGGPVPKGLNCWVVCETRNAETGETDGEYTFGQYLQVDDDGSFTVRGTAGRGQHQLLVAHESILPPEPIPFTPGATGVVVKLSAAHAVAASLLLPEGADLGMLRCSLKPASTAPGATGAPPPAAGKDAQEPRQGTPEPAGSGRADVRWQAVPPGTYTLAIHSTLGTQPLVEIAGVVVPAPANGDPRLSEIDLRNLVRTVELRLFGPDGQRLEEAWGMAMQPPGSAGPEHGHAFWGNPAKLLLPSGPYDLLVGVVGWRPTPLRGHAERIDVHLQAWPTVKVQIADLPKLPPDASLTVQLVPTENGTPGIPTLDAHWGNQEYLVPTSRAELVDGKAEVAIGDGPHQVSLWLGNHRSGTDLPVVSPTRVLHTDGSITVQVSKAAWQRALEALQPEGAPAGRGSGR